MKVIKEGDMSRMKDVRWYHAVCPQCGCVFEFHWAEVTHYYGYDSSHIVTCPTCRGIINLMSDNVKRIER